MPAADLTNDAAHTANYCHAAVEKAQQYYENRLHAEDCTAPRAPGDDCCTEGRRTAEEATVLTPFKAGGMRPLYSLKTPGIANGRAEWGSKPALEKSAPDDASTSANMTGIAKDDPACHT